MAYCTNCGNKLIDGDRFCRECGYKVKVQLAAPPPPTPAPMPPSPPPMNQQPMAPAPPPMNQQQMADSFKVPYALNDFTASGAVGEIIMNLWQRPQQSQMHTKRNTAGSAHIRQIIGRVMIGVSALLFGSGGYSLFKSCGKSPTQSSTDTTMSTVSKQPVAQAGVLEDGYRLEK